MQEDCVNWEWSIVGRQARPVRRNSSSLHGWSELMTERLLQDEDGASSSSSRSSEGGGTMKSTCRTNGRTDDCVRQTCAICIYTVVSCAAADTTHTTTPQRLTKLVNNRLVCRPTKCSDVSVLGTGCMLTSRAQRITAYYYSVLPPTRRSTLGDRAFPAAAPRTWNDLPPTIRASPSLLTFRRQLTTLLSSYNISLT